MREIRLALVFAFLVLPTASTWQAEQRRFGAFELADAPRLLGGLPSVGDAELEELILEEVEPSAYLMRAYSDGRTQALAYVAFYTGFGSTAAHDPQVCYPAQGFDIGSIRDIAVELSDGSRIWSKVFRARQGAFEEVVLHWFQPMDRWPAGPRLEPWVRMLEAFRGHKAYAFVRVSVEIGARGVGHAEELAIGMAAELAPWSRAVLSRATSPQDAGGEA